jgi:Ca2+-binding RTX toxin-like protein
MSDPIFSAPITNPFPLFNVNLSASNRTSVDIDGDGDLDTFVGNYEGNTLFYRNTGSASSATFAAPITNPFGLKDVGYSSRPTFADIDGDGDLDAFIGNFYGETMFFRNNSDVTAPTATIVVADSSLSAGETSLVTITFSEAVTGFTNDDLAIANGTLTNVTSADSGKTWTATFTPTANISDTTNLITLNNTGVVDLAGNAGVGSTNSNNYAIDTARPTATIVVADNSLRIGETSLVTITFSEAVTGFTNADLTIANGTLTNVASSNGGITWTATLTPTTNISDTTNIITLSNTGVSDSAGNAGAGTTDSNNYAIDTARPTATIVVADNSLRIGETSLVTITFSEAATSFTSADLEIANGTLNSLSSSDGGVTWTATLTPTTNISDTTNIITLDNTGVADLAGNAGTGTTNSGNYAIDTARPTATIVVADSSLSAGETSLVTITFSEAVTGFTSADLTIANGTLNSLSSSDGGVTWTATLTPTTNISDTTNIITLDNTGVVDLAGNAGVGTTDSGNYAIDTARPTATIVVADSSLSAGETSLVTITFSEAVTGFTSADLTIANGTLNSLSSSDGGVTWTATLTPTTNISDTTNIITLDNTGVVDLAGNAGVGTTDSGNYVIETSLTPTITSVTYNSITGTLEVTGTDFLALAGANNDIDVSKLTITGEGGTTYTLTSGNVEITSGTQFIVTLNRADKIALSAIINQNGISSIGGSTYNLAAAENWAAGANAIVIDVDSNNELTANSNIFTLVAANFGLSDVGSSSNPTLVDIDGDGDLDAFVGNKDGNTLFYENTGSATFAAATTNPFGLSDVGSSSNPTLVDIDGDGDLDAFVGNKDGNTLFYENTGSASSATFAAATTNPFGLSDIGQYSSPTFVDIDRDGDLDAFIGNYDGNTLFYENTGSASSATFAAATTNPFGLSDVGYSSKPTFVDIDGDGDLDAFVGNSNGNTLFYENTGSASSATFAAATNNPFGLSDVGYLSSPTLVDIDKDGDLDAFVGNSDGNTLFFLNNSLPTAKIVVADMALLVGETSLVTITFSKAVTGFTNDDLTIANGTLTNVTSTDSGKTWTATFTPNTNISDATNIITLDNTGVADLAGNAGVGTTDSGNYAIETSLTPTITSVTYNSITGTLEVTGTDFLALAGADNDIDVSKLTIAGEGGATYTLTSGNVEITSGTKFIVTLNGADKTALGAIINRDGVSSIGGSTYNLAAAENWAAGANAIVIDVDSNNGLTANSNIFTLVAANFGLSDVGFYSTPTFVDIDEDGDLDAFVGERYGNTLFYENTGSASSATFAAATTNPFGLSDVGYSSKPTFVDIDRDGDLDAFIGNYDGNTLFYENTGSATFAAATTNPFGLSDVGSWSTPTFVDIDRDGDLDAFVGNSNGNTLFYENTGSASSATFAAATTNPFGLSDVGSWSTPTFVDIDRDGDLDAFVGNSNGNTLFYENTGSASSATFAAATTNSFGLSDVGSWSTPTFVDIDRDGDLDAFVGERYGNTLFYENTGSASSATFAAATTNPFGLSDVGYFSSPTFVDIDGDGDLDALIGNDSGNTLFFRNGSTASNDAVDITQINQQIATGTLLANDSGNYLRITGLTSTSGNAQLNNNGTPTNFSDDYISYHLSVGYGYTGTDSFTYTINDGTRNSTPATVTLNIAIPQLDGDANNNTLVGSAYADIIDGKAGNDILIGGSGNDTLYGSEGNDLLRDNLGNDSLVGGAGNDNLYAGTGADTLEGGAGNDSYYISYYATEGTNDTIIETVDGGIDTAYSVLAVDALADNVERLVLIGTANINATGNTLDNIISGNSGDNSLDGGTGNDILRGYAGDDRLMGSAGNDNLYGGEGADTLVGGAGNDIYYLSYGSDTVNDSISEDADSGTDGAYSILTVAALADNVENLVLLGTGSINATGNSIDNIIYGNSGDNSLDGGDGKDIISGGAGNDTIMGGAGNDTISGNAGNDSITGGTNNDTLRDTLGNDTLIGGEGDDNLYAGEGADSLQGGAGNDVYYISYGTDTANDVIAESAAGGTDTAYSILTVDALAAHVEYLRLIGTADVNATGNSENNVIYGNSGNNSLDGDTGNDVLRDTLGNDTLIGGEGNDNFYGGEGTDSLVGGTGNDIYYISYFASEGSNDVIVEAADEGYDTAYSVLAVTALAANVERLILLGTSDIKATGNDLNNTIYGNSGSNMITGGKGNDVLIGGTGIDTFVLNTPNNGIDYISDFAASEKLDISSFGLSTFTLLTGAGVTTANAANQFIFNTTNGSLYFDADGASGNAAVQIATLRGVSSLTIGDFLNSVSV